MDTLLAAGSLPTIFLVIALISWSLALFIGSGLLEVLIGIGAGFLTTAGLLHLGVLDPNANVAFALATGLSVLFSIVLWKPLRNSLQAAEGVRSPDLIGSRFQLPDDFAKTESAYFSGVKWKICSDVPLNGGDLVTIYRADVGVLWVKP